MRAQRGDDIDEVGIEEEVEFLDLEGDAEDDGLLLGNSLLDGTLPGEGEPFTPPAQPLTEEQIEEIAGLLRSGRRLPPHFLHQVIEIVRTTCAEMEVDLR